MRTWKYIILLGRIARIAPGEVEIRRLDNDQWVPCTDRDLLWSVDQDGTIVSEAEALEAHEIFKKQASQS